MRGEIPVSAAITGAASSSAGCRLAAAAIKGRAAAWDDSGAKARQAEIRQARRCISGFRYS
jgi:hypothetical protein